MSDKSNPKNLETDISALNFEQSMRELEKIVTSLENGTISLEESIHAYERGTLLKKQCEAKLSEAKLRVEKINLGTDGNLKTTDFESE